MVGKRCGMFEMVETFGGERGMMGRDGDFKVTFDQPMWTIRGT
jgi:hypothetical protein